MIKTKEDLNYYMECDKKALGINHSYPKIIGDRIWKYERLYRKVEYYWNNRTKNLFYKMLGNVYKYYWKYKSLKLGNEIPVNCIEEGLCIWHGQNIIINPKSRIGKWFSVSTGCIVGQAHNEFPTIGDNVQMTVDSKVLGGVTVCDNVVIGAGAVVIKNIDIPNSSWGGYQLTCYQ
jgi:serine O-acetyltransferase